MRDIESVLGEEPSLCRNSLSRKSSCSTTQKRWGVSYARLAFDRAFEPQRKFSKVKQGHIRKKHTWQDRGLGFICVLKLSSI